MLFDRVLKFMQDKLAIPVEKKLNEETESDEIEGLDPCRFCFETKQLYQDIDKEGGRPLYNIYCGRCSASGPTADTLEKAKELWNMMTGIDLAVAKKLGIKNAK